MADRYAGTGAGEGGSKGYFSSGKGMPWEAHPYKSPDKTNVERNRKIEIDLEDLEHPGKGPINFTHQRGRMMPSVVKNAPEGQPASGDIK